MRLEAGDQEGIQRLIQCFLRCPFCQTRMIRLRPGRATAGQVEVTDAGKVIYKTEHNAVDRFPDPGDAELLAGLTAAGGSGPGLTEQETQEKAGGWHPAQR